jgi:pimeloyl-ACP methyl ester carboxylesterase
MAMPVGYLFNVGVVAVCTAVALVGPRPAHTTQSHWSFWLTFLINEQPFLAFSWLFLITTLAFAQGDLTSPAAKAACGVAALTGVGLAVLGRRALRAGPALDQSLAEWLGPDWRPHSGAESARPARWWRLAHILVVPFLVRRPDVVRVANIRYGDAGKQNLLQPGFTSADTSVTGVICFFGYYGRLGGPLDAISSPLDQLNRDAPPFFVIHGGQDSLTLVEDTREFVSALHGVSTQPVVYAEPPGAQHNFDLFHSLRYTQVIRAVEEFATRVRTPQP